MSLGKSGAGDVLIIGASGQDGTLLARSLVEYGYQVYAASRHVPPDGRLPAAVRFMRLDVRDSTAVASVIEETRPSVVYYLSAFTHSSTARHAAASVLTDYLAVNVNGFDAALAAIARHVPTARVIYAASSHAFGHPAHAPQTEETPLRPVSLYGISKAAGLGICRHYRETRAMHVSAAILYNHESPFRDRSFVTAHLAGAAAAIANGQRQPVRVRDLDAIVDWSAARDVVEALQLMAQAEEPDDYIVASGIGRTVRDFAAVAFGVAGLDWQDWIVSPSAAPVRSVVPYVGCADRIRERLGWKPRVSFEQLVQEMVDAFMAA